MSGYDWFITLVAIPFAALGFSGVALLICVVAHDVWTNR